MSKQVIISIGRNLAVADMRLHSIFADRFSLPLYDYNLLREIAQEKKCQCIQS